MTPRAAVCLCLCLCVSLSPSHPHYTHEYVYTPRRLHVCPHISSTRDEDQREIRDGVDVFLWSAHLRSDTLFWFLQSGDMTESTQRERNRTGRGILYISLIENRCAARTACTENNSFLLPFSSLLLFLQLNSTCESSPTRYNLHSAYT